MHIRGSLAAISGVITWKVIRTYLSNAYQCERHVRLAEKDCFVLFNKLYLVIRTQILSHCYAGARYGPHSG